MSRSFGSSAVDDALVDADFPRRNRLEAGDHAQQGRLAAAGRADENDELAIGDVDGDAVNHRNAGKGFFDVDDLNRGHVCAFPVYRDDRRARRTRMAWKGFAGHFHRESRHRLGLGHGAAALAQPRQDRRGDALGRRHRHLPGVDDVDFIVAVVVRQPVPPDDRLMLAEIDQPEIAIEGGRNPRSTASRRSEPDRGPVTTSASTISRRKPTRFQLSPRSSPPFAHHSRSCGCM